MSGASAPGGGATTTLTGGALILAGFVLAMSNFMAVLDTSIANVSIPNIAGGLAVSPSEGTWVITSYQVAEAITVPLTGWLAQRFGAVKVYVTCITMFGLFSALCGLAPSLSMLVFFRIMQGLAGGPMMPMSQTLLLRVFPPQQAPQAIGIWSMTTVGGTDRRTAARRHVVGQFRLALVGVLRQHSGGDLLRRVRLAPVGQAGERHSQAPHRWGGPWPPCGVRRRHADRARQGPGVGLAELPRHHRPDHHRRDRVRVLPDLGADGPRTRS